MTGVVQIYEELKRKGIDFPMSDLDVLSPIHTPKRVQLPLSHPFTCSSILSTKNTSVLPFFNNFI